LDKNPLNKNKEINTFIKEDNFNSNRSSISLFLFILFLSLASIASYFYFINSSDTINIITKDPEYPFKTFPTINKNSDNNIEFQESNVYTTIVEPDNLDLPIKEMINTSYTDGTELDKAEKSISLHYDIEKNEILAVDRTINIKDKKLDLPEPIEPSNNNSGVFIKTPTIVSILKVDRDLNILDQEIISAETFIIENNIFNINQKNISKNKKSINKLNQSNDIKLLEINNIDQSEKNNDTKMSIVSKNTVKYNISTENTLLTEDVAKTKTLNKEELIPINVAETDKELDNILNKKNKLPLFKPLEIAGKILNNNLFESSNDDLINNKILEFKKDFYGIQVASLETRLEANNFYKTLLINYSNLLNSNNPEHINLIKVDNLGNLGTWYKVRIGPFESRSKAKKLCSSLRDSGLEGCIVKELE